MPVCVCLLKPFLCVYLYTKKRVICAIKKPREKRRKCGSLARLSVGRRPVFFLIGFSQGFQMCLSCGGWLPTEQAIQESIR